MPALIGVLTANRQELDYATMVLLVLVQVVLVSLVGGVRVGLPASIAGVLALNWFLTPPYGTLDVADADQLLVLVTFLAVAVAVSVVVGVAASASDRAARAKSEAHALSALAGRVLAERSTLADLLEHVRVTFSAHEVLLQERVGAGWRSVECRGCMPDDVGGDENDVAVSAGPDLQVVIRGRPLFAEDRRVLTALAQTVAVAYEGRQLAEQAAAAARFEAGDRMRTALLNAVGHDLRTPLAGLKAAVTSLRSDDVTWTEPEVDELLETIETSTDRLQSLVENLLDASRLQAGAVNAHLEPTGLAESVDRALMSLGYPERVHLDVPESLPDILADGGLVERIIANLVENALRYSPPGTMVTIRAAKQGAGLRCDIEDHGPGLSAASWAKVSAPFQRLGDRTPGGLGLGLTVARGFAAAMGAGLAPVGTRTQGLTMRLTLPLAVLPEPTA
jgi:K+-sensing histidine kinase KdpD